MRDKLSIYLTIITLYVLFVELMIPDYFFLPKISVLYNSFIDIYKTYPIKSGFLDTFISVTVSSLLVYTTFKMLGPLVCYLYINISAIRLINVFYKFTPVIFFMAIFILIFNFSYTAEIIFLCIILSFRYGGLIFDTLGNIPSELINSYRSMYNGTFTVMRKVLWRHALIEIKKKSSEYFIAMWGYAIVYEVLGNSVGLGKIIIYLLEFQDYYGLVALTVVVSFFIFMCTVLINFVVRNSTFWEI